MYQNSTRIHCTRVLVCAGNAADVVQHQNARDTGAGPWCDSTCDGVTPDHPLTCHTRSLSLFIPLYAPPYLSSLFSGAFEPSHLNLFNCMKEQTIKGNWLKVEERPSQFSPIIHVTFCNFKSTFLALRLLVLKTKRQEKEIIPS